jgi:hypothetical protein
MNAYSPPVRISDPLAAWPSDDCCDLCCATPVRTELDGDKLCQSCADKWCRNEGVGFTDDLLPMSHPVMREASRKYQSAADDAVGRLIADLAKGQRRFGRSGL